MATTITIDGVTRKVRQGSLSITETTNGVNVLEAEVVSRTAAIRPAIGAEIIVTRDAVRIFGGYLDAPAEAGIDNIPRTAISTRISAVDYNSLVWRRFVGATFAAGTLKSMLTTIVADYLSTYGVTLDGAQVNGPTLPALVCRQPLSEVMNTLSQMTNYVWEIDYNKVLRMKQPSATAAPFNITTGDGRLSGDVAVEPTREDYANRVHVFGGTGQQNVTDEFVGNGSQTAFVLDYSLVSNIGGVTNGGVVETLGETGSGMTWIHTSSGGVSTITRSSAPANLAAISITYTAQFPKQCTASNSAEITANGLWEKALFYTDIFDVDVLQELADAAIDRFSTTRKVVTFATASAGLSPGQTITLTMASRNVSGTYTITDVTTKNTVGGAYLSEVRAVEGNLYTSSWKDVLKEWSAGGSSGAGASASVTVVSGGTAGSGTAGYLAQWADPATLTDGPLASAVVLTSGSYANPAWLTSLAGSKLTGTIASAVQDNITRTGTLVSGATGAGFTVALSTSTITGNLAYARLPSGSGTWTATPTINGTLTMDGHILPASSDTYDLGRYDRLWGQGYISQLNALVFALTTQTIFGGYSTIGHGAGSLGAAVASGASTVNFGQAMTVGDWVLIRAHDTSGTIRSEYLLVGTLSSGTTYNVTRDLAAASSPDPAWANGTPYLILGASGDGRIDMIAADGKPRIVFTQQGATYGASNDRAVIGNLNGYFGYASDLWGAAFGSATGAWVKIDTTNGLRLGHNADTFVKISTAGAATFEGDITIGANGSVIAGGVVLDDTGLYISPVSAAGSFGAFANANAVRWTTDATYHTAIWRADDSTNAYTELKVNHVAPTATVIARNSFLVEGGTGGSRARTYLKSQTYSSTSAEFKLFAQADTNTSGNLAMVYGLSYGASSYASLYIGLCNGATTFGPDFWTGGYREPTMKTGCALVFTTAGIYEIGETDPIGSWVTYTPTWSSTGTAPAIGNGSISGRTMRMIGNTRRARITLTLGSTSTLGTGAWTFSLPTTALVNNPLGFAQMLDVGIGIYLGVAQLFSSTVITVYAESGHSPISAASPFAFVNGDSLVIDFEYEEA